MTFPSRPHAGDSVQRGVPDQPWWSMTVSTRDVAPFVVHTPYPPPQGMTTLKVADQDGRLDENQQAMWTAIHEAGHAQIALTVGISFSSVVLHATSQPGEPGMLTNGHIAIDDYHVDYLDLLTFHAAGVRAGHRWLADNGLLTVFTAFCNDVVHGASDRRQTLAAHSSRPVQLTYGTGRPSDLPAETAHLDMAEVYRRADLLLDRRWPAVLAVARHLTEHGQMAPDKVQAVTERALGTSSPWRWGRRNRRNGQARDAAPHERRRSETP